VFFSCFALVIQISELRYSLINKPKGEIKLKLSGFKIKYLLNITLRNKIPIQHIPIENKSKIVNLFNPERINESVHQNLNANKKPVILSNK
jgi:hypothetical protein